MEDFERNIKILARTEGVYQTDKEKMAVYNSVGEFFGEIVDRVKTKLNGGYVNSDFSAKLSKMCAYDRACRNEGNSNQVHTLYYRGTPVASVLEIVGDDGHIHYMFSDNTKAISSSELENKISN